MAGAMEQMIASMLGINPAEMAQMATQVQTGLLAMTTALANIEQQNRDILAKLEGLENGGRNNSNRKPGKPTGNSGELNGGSNQPTE